jgi:teichuronic acid biosynthesis glycosyltransferase TuaC
MMAGAKLGNLDARSSSRYNPGFRRSVGRMRILVVTSQFPVAGEPTRGRPIHQTLIELARLAEVRVLSPIARYPRWAKPTSYLYRAPDPAQPVSACDVVYVTYPALPLVTRPLNGWLCGRALRAQARAFNPDVILSYWLYPDARGALKVARELAVPLVAGARGSDIRVRDPISRRLTTPVVRQADRLLVVSADLGRLAASDYGADPARVRVIANGCDAATFHRRDRDEARTRCAIAPDVELVLYVGRLVAEKGLRELVEAMRIVRLTHPRAELVLVGDGPLRQEFAELAQDPAIRLRLVGAQPADEVARWMAACNLLALPSYSEGHPNVLVEALACGRPVVSTPVGGVPEVVDESCAVLIPPRDAKALAGALASVLERDWDEVTLSQRFSRSWEDVARETHAACVEALAIQRTGARE